MGDGFAGVGRQARVIAVRPQPGHGGLVLEEQAVEPVQQRELAVQDCRVDGRQWRAGERGLERQQPVERAQPATAQR